MAKVTYVGTDGDRQAIDVPTGTSVMQAAVNSGIDGIVGECGGQAMCATCHVYVDTRYADRLPAMSDDEDIMLDDAACPREARSRLSCQLPVIDELNGLVVEIPEEQL